MTLNSRPATATRTAWPNPSSTAGTSNLLPSDGLTGSRRNASTGPDRATETRPALGRYLGSHRDDAPFRTVRVAPSSTSFIYCCHRRSSHRHGNISKPFFRCGTHLADDVGTAIGRSGLRRDYLGSDVLRYAVDGLLELVRDPTGQAKGSAIC